MTTDTTTSATTSREPVLNAATVASLLTTFVGLALVLLVVTHTITPDDSSILAPAITTAITTVVGALSTLVAAFRARGQVTPLADPRDEAGNALTPDEPGEHSLEAAAARADTEGRDALLDSEASRSEPTG